jgi:hypothetical protein
MDIPIARRAGQPAGPARRGRAAGLFRGRGMPARITAASCAALLTGAALLLAAGCSASGASSASGSSAGAGSFAESAPSGPGAGDASAAHARVPAASGGLDAKQAGRLAAASQSIIYTASLTVTVRDVTGAAATAAGYASAAGGYTSAENALPHGNGGRRPTVSLTLKVPVPGYPAALHRIGLLGRQSALSQQSTDVTQQVANVRSRVISERDAIAQLRTLLRRAGTVTGLLQVQEQISSDESALEALLAQQRALDHETSYATISVFLLGPRPHAAAHPVTRHGFTGGLGAGWDGFLSAVGWVLTALGVVLPFAVAAAIVGGLGYAGWRWLSGWLSRRRARPTETA